jgi:hypothetical protein
MLIDYFQSVVTWTNHNDRPITSSDFTRPYGNHCILCEFTGQNSVACYLKVISHPKECVHAILVGQMEILLEHLQRHSICDSRQ